MQTSYAITVMLMLRCLSACDTFFGIKIIMIVSKTRCAGSGVAVSSSNEACSLTLDGLSTLEASAAVIRWLQEKQLGAAQTNYKLRDWLFARQRYWGEPFPIVFEEGSEVSILIATRYVLSIAWETHQLIKGQQALY